MKINWFVLITVLVTVSFGGCLELNNDDTNTVIIVHNYGAQYKVSDNNSMFVEIYNIYYYSIFFLKEIHLLNNSVFLNESDVLIFTNIETGERLRFAYLGAYPSGEAIFKLFESSEEMEKYLSETEKETGKKPLLVYRKTGD